MKKISKSNTRKKQKKVCDDLWKAKIKERDRHCQRPNCPFCHNVVGAKYLQAHHIIMRTNYSLRWDFKNGILLCKASHFSWAHSQDPNVLIEYLHFVKGWADMEYLKLRKYSQSKNDLKMIEIYLRSL